MIQMPREVSELVLAWCLEVVKANGYRLELDATDGPWMTPAELRTRHFPAMNDNTFSKRLRSPDAPPYAHKTSRRGRLLQLQPNDALMAWLARPLDARRQRFEK